MLFSLNLYISAEIHAVFLIGALFAFAELERSGFVRSMKTAVTTAHMQLELDVIDARGNIVSRKMEICKLEIILDWFD